MSDLISRKKVIDILEKEKSLNCGYDADIAIFSIEKRIRELPTVYDIDKVVEELKDSSKIYCEEYNQRDGNLHLLDAIEIVKQGGVADDVCEWECKYINDKYSYLTSCGNIFIYETNSVYCPYCGKKIKVVE